MSRPAVLEQDAGEDAGRHRGWLSALVDSPTWLGAAMIAPAVAYIALVVGVPFVLALYFVITFGRAYVGTRRGV